MDKKIFVNKLFDYSCSTIPEEKRIIQILLKESKFNEILEIVTKEDEFIWLRSKGNDDSNSKKYTEYTYVNGIAFTFCDIEQLTLPIYYFSNRYKYEDGKFSENIESFYDKELEGIVIINKFKWDE